MLQRSKLKPSDSIKYTIAEIVEMTYEKKASNPLPFFPATNNQHKELIIFLRRQKFSGLEEMKAALPDADSSPDLPIWLNNLSKKIKQMNALQITELHFNLSRLTQAEKHSSCYGSY